MCLAFWNVLCSACRCWGRTLGLTLVFCIPALGLAQTTCVTDSFTTGSLNTSLWNALAISGSYTPQVATVGSQGRLRLTTASGNQATMVQLKKWFPGAANKIVVTFDYYVYDGNGADGVVMVLSDALVSPAPGAAGGSLGYAQAGSNGFAGGWLGFGLDEYGNFPNTNEGRQGYPSGWTPPAGANSPATGTSNSVVVRGSGSGTTGYRLLANTGRLNPVLWNNSSSQTSVQRFRITVDNSTSVAAMVKVERDTTGTGNSYVAVVPSFNANGANSGQATLPTNWLVSFTGGTGGSHNIHELANVNICATYMTEPGGSSTPASFDCLETDTNAPWSALSRKPLYTKLAGTAFKLDVAALRAAGTLESNYVAAGGNSKYVKVELFDSTTASSCAAYANPLASQTVTFASGKYSGAAGRALTGDFTVNGAYKNVVCRVKECTSSACTAFTTAAPACSSDQFSVRPGVVTMATNATAAAPAVGSTPKFKAGGDAFTLRGTTALTTYAGTLSLDTSKLTAQTPAQATSVASGGVVGALSISALTANAAATDVTYDEVGYLYMGTGAFRDDAWTAVDRATGDCITTTAGDAYLSAALSGGKYGCSIGNSAALTLGRFYPDHFALSNTGLTPMCAAASPTPAVPYTYFGQDGFTTSFTMTAQNRANGTTRNYAGVYAKFVPTVYANYGFSASNLPAGASLAASTTAPAGSWGGADSASAGTISVVAKHQVSRPTLPAESVLTVSAAPSDGETSLAATEVANSVRLRYGRLRMTNAYGSELMNLPISLEAQYWNGSMYVTHTADSCTTLPMKSVVMSNYSGDLVACETQLLPALTTATFSAGKLTGLALTKPGAGNSGSVDLAVNTGASASGTTCVSSTASAASAGNVPWLGANPTAKATFGVYKSPLIYLRENY